MLKRTPQNGRLRESAERPVCVAVGNDSSKSCIDARRPHRFAIQAANHAACVGSAPGAVVSRSARTLWLALVRRSAGLAGVMKRKSRALKWVCSTWLSSPIGETDKPGSWEILVKLSD